MTAILNELRILDERFNRGDLTCSEYTARRNAVLQSVEEAETDFASTRAPRRAARSAQGSGAWGLSIVICLGVMGVSIGFILLFLPDLNLALTVGVTILAALTVALLRQLDD